jgi:nitrite reductase (NO-forming)
VIALLGLVFGVAGFIAGLTADREGTPAGKGAVPDYGPERALMKDIDHAGDAHRATAGTRVEAYNRPDPSLPAVPAGRIKRFEVDVAERVTRVSAEKPALRVWSYSVNGRMLSGTGGSPPIVVDQGDTVEVALTNGSTDAMEVHFPHSFDTHASEVSPQNAYRDVDPSKTLRFRFVAKHPGVFMYHCGTRPVLRHVGAGMAGMMVVRPRGLAEVDRELWLTQQEYYIGRPKEDASVEKMRAKRPDVIAFNGFASQYLDRPIPVRRGERLRIWVLNAGPSLPSYFHVIGSVFDRVWSEGDTRRHSQTMSLGPAEGGFVELTLDEEGTYPFVTHAFADMARGAIGALKTTGAGSGERGKRRPVPDTGHGHESGDEH